MVFTPVRNIGKPFLLWKFTVWYWPLILCIATVLFFLYMNNFKAHQYQCGIIIIIIIVQMSLCMWTSLAVSGKNWNATGYQTVVRTPIVNVCLNKMCCGSIFIFVCTGACTSKPRILLSGDRNNYSKINNIGPSTAWFKQCIVTKLLHGVLECSISSQNW